MMEYAARKATRGNPDSTSGSHNQLLRKWHHAVGVRLCLRRAAMQRAVLPSVEPTGDASEAVAPCETALEQDEAAAAAEARLLCYAAEVVG